MKYILVLFLLCLTGCSTTYVPVTRHFPEPPGTDSLESCPELKKLPDDTKLSGIASTIGDNYTTYYECAVKVDKWSEWYKVQKNIFESVK